MKNKKVLIVDDNALNRRVFEHIIGQVYQYESAENGRIALEKIRGKFFDLILMDIQMPELDGINTLKIIRTDRLTSAPVIAVSAFASADDRDYFLSAGFHDFIPKPISPKHLLETIHRYLGGEDDLASEDIHKDQSQKVISETIVKQLLKYNSQENVRIVYEDFIEETERLLAEIETLIRDENYDQIGEKLHIMKGNSGTLGAMQIFNFASEYEANIKNNNYDNTLKDYLYLKQLYHSFKDYFQSSQFLSI